MNNNIADDDWYTHNLAVQREWLADIERTAFERRKRDRKIDLVFAFFGLFAVAVWWWFLYSAGHR